MERELMMGFDAEGYRPPKWAWWLTGAAIPVIGILVSVLINGSSAGDSPPHAKGTSSPKPAASSTPLQPKPSTNSATGYGKQLLRQRGIDLSVGKGLSLDDDPLRPSDNYGDINYEIGAGSPTSFGVSWDVALLMPTQPRTYETCRDDTRFIENGGYLFRDELPAGSAVCMTNPENGHIALVRVTHRSSSTAAVDYLTLDVTIWQGPVRDSSSG
jgi:hypothetical protein